MHAVGKSVVPTCFYILIYAHNLKGVRGHLNQVGIYENAGSLWHPNRKFTVRIKDWESKLEPHQPPALHTTVRIKD